MIVVIILVKRMMTIIVIVRVMLVIMIMMSMTIVITVMTMMIILMLMKTMMVTPDMTFSSPGQNRICPPWLRCSERSRPVGVALSSSNYVLITRNQENPANKRPLPSHKCADNSNNFVTAIFPFISFLSLRSALYHCTALHCSKAHGSGEKTSFFCESFLFYFMIIFF